MKGISPNSLHSSPVLRMLQGTWGYTVLCHWLICFLNILNYYRFGWIYSGSYIHVCAIGDRGGDSIYGTFHTGQVSAAIADNKEPAIYLFSTDYMYESDTSTMYICMFGRSVSVSGEWVA